MTMMIDPQEEARRQRYAEALATSKAARGALHNYRLHRDTIHGGEPKKGCKRCYRTALRLKRELQTALDQLPS